MQTRYSISLSPKNSKHKAIDEFIQNNVFSDGRGLRVQPLFEDLLYACATSGMSLFAIVAAIRNAGDGHVSERNADSRSAGPSENKEDAPANAETRASGAASAVARIEPPEIAPTESGDARERFSSTMDALADGVLDMLGDSR